MTYFKRIVWLDAVKGIAILFVVFGHVVESISKSAMANTPEIMNQLHQIITTFHMPLFICLSGFSFAIAYVKPSGIDWSRWKRQVYNLGLLYIGYSVIYWLFKFCFSVHTNEKVGVSDLLMIPIKALQHYWYLYTLIVLYCIMIPMVKMLRESSGINMVISVVLVVGGWISLLANWLKISTARLTILCTMFYFFFFFLGYILWQKDKLLLYMTKNGLWDLLFWGGILSYMGHRMFVEVEFTAGSLLCRFLFRILAIGFCIGFCILLFGTESKEILSVSVCYIGKHSLEIYLLHVFFVSGLRPVLRKLGVSVYYPLFLILFIAGIIMPLLISALLQKLHLWDYFFRPVNILYRNPLNKKIG